MGYRFVRTHASIRAQMRAHTQWRARARLLLAWPCLSSVLVKPSPHLRVNGMCKCTNAARTGVLNKQIIKGYAECCKSRDRWSGWDVFVVDWEWCWATCARARAVVWGESRSSRLKVHCESGLHEHLAAFAMIQSDVELAPGASFLLNTNSVYLVSRMLKQNKHKFYSQPWVM